MSHRRAFLSTAAAAVAVSLAVPARAAVHVVEIRRRGFVPADLTVASGDQVTFVNRDSRPHTATADGGAFDTGWIESFATATLTVVGAGHFPYACTIHPRMRGTITVR